MIFVYKRCIIRCTASFSYPLPFSSARSRHPCKGIRPRRSQTATRSCHPRKAIRPAVLKRPRDRAIRARAYAPAVLKRPRDRAIRARAYAPAVLKRPRDRAIRAKPYGPPFSNVRAIEPSAQSHTAHLSHRQPDHITHAKSPLPIFSAPPTAHRCSFPKSDRSHENGPPIGGPFFIG